MQPSTAVDHRVVQAVAIAETVKQSLVNERGQLESFVEPVEGIAVPSWRGDVVEHLAVFVLEVLAAAHTAVRFTGVCSTAVGDEPYVSRALDTRPS
jgi:hypothetical protein